MTTRALLLTVLILATATSSRAQDGPDTGKTPAPSPCQVKAYRPFDLGAHGLNFAVRAAVTRGCDRFLAVYDPALRVAALVDPRTGLAEVAVGFSAGVADSDRGPIVFDDVEALDGLSLLWWHRGATWAHDWPIGTLPVWDLKALRVDGVPVFRWR